MYLSPARAHRQYRTPRSSRAGLRHSDPPRIHLQATRLRYAGTTLSCCARCLLSNFLSNCPTGFSLSPSPNLYFLSGRPIFHRLTNSAASSPLQNGSNPDSYGNRVCGQSAGRFTPHPGLRPAPLPRKRVEGQSRVRGDSSLFSERGPGGEVSFRAAGICVASMTPRRRTPRAAGSGGPGLYNDD